jgi:hypothetical protein
MVPQLLQRHGSIAITIQGLEVATDPGDALGFLAIQATVLVTVGFLEMTLQARATGS